MSVEKLHPSGAIRVSAIIGGYLVSRVYFGYSKRQAVAMFKAEFPRWED